MKATTTPKHECPIGSQVQPWCPDDLSTCGAAVCPYYHRHLRYWEGGGK